MKHGVEFGIRGAMLDDVDALVALTAKSFRQTYQGATDPEDVERHIALNFTRDRIGLELADPEASVLLGCLGDQPIAYALLRKGSAPDCVPGDAPVELVRLYVLRENIGAGFGSALMRACLDEQKRLQCDPIWLGVWDQNARARTFYEKWGFQQVGRYEFLFGGTPYQDLVMVRRKRRCNAENS
jgi:diamine N-acetyltransferase